MPDYFETGFSAEGRQAWHGFMNVREEAALTAEQAILASELDWLVELQPLYAGIGEGPSYITVPEHYAVVRDRDNAVLGVVGNRYEPMQNYEAFQFMDDLVDSSDAKYITAGSLKGGKRIWLLSKLNREILIGGDESEKIEPYLLLTKGHDGSHGIQVLPTGVRVVCWNTLSQAIHGARRMWSTKHTSGAKGRIQAARETLELSIGYYDALEAMGNALISQPFSDKDFEKFTQALIPVNDEMTDLSKKTREEQREALITLRRRSPNIENIRDTKWGAYQTVTEFDDWFRPVRGKNGQVEERRFTRAVLKPKLKNQALGLLAPEWAGKMTAREEALATD